ncbi:MAG TPA: RtcB family protein [Firmicutes bacterium]|nr:RtcB family protein [Bacillota bacterium]
MEGWAGPLERIDEFRWMIPHTYKKGMRVSGIIFAHEGQISQIRKDQAPEQVANVAFLPGIVGSSLAMPDIHWGYGFAIGGVAATLYPEGVVSPGGVGFDINCGVRLLRTNLKLADIEKHLEELVQRLFKEIPAGAGSEGVIKLGNAEITRVLEEGARWAVEKGFGKIEDLDRIEEYGVMQGADPQKVSDKAIRRGIPQLGTLGSGNHFLEIQLVEEIYDHRAAEIMGLEPGSITLMIHTGSRGLGHQVCTDYLVAMNEAVRKYGISLPDRQLACAPLDSQEGKDYLAAMACAANYAWANRQCITHWARRVFEKVLGSSENALGMDLIYDVAHNIAKIEEHEIAGRRVKLCVHRKGATRAFPAGSCDLPEIYQKLGQPVLVPGDMGRNSYLLLGTEKAMAETFGSTCHGAGRIMSRSQAKRDGQSGKEIESDLRSRGIIVRAASRAGLAEEASSAYKDVNEVVRVCQGAGISRMVARMRPLGVIKG